LQILKGKPSEVAAGMRRAATLRQLSTAECKPVDTCADYLLKYQDMLHYGEYLAQGLPIATGVIEGAAVTSLKVGWTLPVHAGLEQCRSRIEAPFTPLQRR
jgi:hypothetical protein